MAWLSANDDHLWSAELGKKSEWRERPWRLFAHRVDPRYPLCLAEVKPRLVRQWGPQSSSLCAKSKADVLSKPLQVQNGPCNWWSIGERRKAAIMRIITLRASSEPR